MASLYEYKEIMQNAVGDMAATVGPVYTEEDDVDKMIFSILDDDAPIMVIIQRFDYSENKTWPYGGIGNTRKT